MGHGHVAVTYVAYARSAVAIFWLEFLLSSVILNRYLRNWDTFPQIRRRVEVLAPLLFGPALSPHACTFHVAEVPDHRPLLDARHNLLQADLAAHVAVPPHHYAAHVLGLPVPHVLRNEDAHR